MVKLCYVRNDNGLVNYFLALENEKLEKGDKVIVATSRGLQCGEVVRGAKEYDEKDVPMDVFSIKRLATEEDKIQHLTNIEDAKLAKEKAIELVRELSLDMKIMDANYTFDRNQLLFTFISEERVDFRELAKRLAQLYHTRIELRQIGVRDKAKEIGGIGPCGRFLCCKQFLTDFDSVSINMAKNQYIALNPTKINGVCGRLLCCLKYEDDQYREMKKNVPKIGQIVEISGVKGKVSSVNLLNGSIILELPNKIFQSVKLEDYNGSTK